MYRPLPSCGRSTPHIDPAASRIPSIQKRRNPMANSNLKHTRPFGPLGIVALSSCTDLGEHTNNYLLQWRSDREFDPKIDTRNTSYADDKSYLVHACVPRFGTGEAKGLIKQSVRGLDIYIMVDVTNYSVTYSVSGHENHMSPDDHYADLKRIIAAVEGKARRITVIMPFLYEGRQHRRSSRESLDCAVALQELVAMGVDNIITFDAHDPRVQNAIPLHGFETVQPAYQFIKGICSHCDDIRFDNDHLMIVSPDEGGTNRAVYMASVLGVDMGMFYKRRDYSRIVGGRNPIVAHEFLGSDVEGKDVIVVDDMISSGDSMIEVATELKKRNARRIFVVSTFGLFTNGLERFDKAVEEGLIYKVLTTNLVYQTPELLSRDWYISCEMSKYIAYIIDTLNHDMSISDLLDPYKRIEKIVTKYKKEHK